MEAIMAIFHSKYGTGLVVHGLSTDSRTVDLAVNGGGPTSQRFLILTTVKKQRYSYCVVRARSYTHALGLALKEHDRLGHPRPQLCGVIGEAENEVSGGTCLVCLEFHRGSKGVWQITRPVLFFPSDGFHGLARQIVEALGQRRGAADSRAQLASDR